MNGEGATVGSGRTVGESRTAVRTDGGGGGLDRLLDLVSSHRRRYALYYLRKNEAATVDELAEQLATNRETVSESPSTEQLNRARGALIHTVLPRLQAAGCIEYDRRSGTIRYRQPTQSLTTVLDVCSELESAPMESE
ncbi:hypothetical protein [Natrinema sp. 1APR25-10V2]|uniref:DUF7344 domain-containing protein n=1 Tax=Natrinema sp. 1APR25-10V2 TaxID=2951081 RepID=UPI002876DD7B|nr:hypothetical protein [Natrinema sp. 1APR25-10V2]MDS0475793.1 hypothetical protein [Natrinema sp. 1APR25-10V2]